MPTISQDSVEVWSGFKALADPLRTKIIELLRDRELCVCELCQQLDVNQSKLSFHLKNLKDAGLLRSRQQGRWMYYRLNLAQFAVLEEYLAQYRHSASIFPAKDCQ